jgi:basic membrane lipoprotein Med (substrate-binding protein (PBP1-ABC) superfamily)
MAMNRRRWMVLAVCAVFLAIFLASGFFTHNAPAAQAPLAFLDPGSLDTLRADFNRRADEVRIIVLLSPT